MSLVCDGHLGGFITGGDPDTFDPVVWMDIVKKFTPRTMLDIGCGEGHAVKWFLDHGVEAIGVDGSKLALDNSPVQDRILIHDFTQGPLPIGSMLKPDIIWSCEFLEHVEEKYQDNYMRLFSTANLVFLTYSEPQWSEGGHHHVNCKPQEYWDEVFKKYGFKRQEFYTNKLRGIATARWVKPTVCAYFK
jgi:SAM-dependent methyltransferase